MRRQETAVKYLGVVLSVAVVMLLWHGVCLLKVVNPLFLPAPLDTFREGLGILLSGTLLRDLSSSLLRIAAGLVLALITGIPIGFLIGYHRDLYDSVHWIVDFSRSIPPILVFPLCLLIFGTGNLSRVAVIFFGCLFIMILHTSKSIFNISPVRIQTAKVMGARTRHLFFNILIYDAQPGIFVGLRTSLSLAFVIGLVTEMLVGTTYGLGSRIVYAQTSYATEEMYIIIILVGILGNLANRILARVEKKLVHWNRHCQ